MPRDNREERWIQIREFEIEKMNPHSKITINAKPGVGKSVLINDVLKYMRHQIPTGMYVGGTSDTNSDIEGIFPKLFIHNEWNEETHHNYIQRQKLNKRSIQHEVLPNSVVILDDMTQNRNILKSKPIIGYFKNGRQWSNLLIIALQNANDLPFEIRHMADYIFIGREISKEKRNILYECFIPSSISRIDFDDLMDQITENHTWLVVHNRVNSNEIEDIIFWYRANPNIERQLDGTSRIVYDFRFGCEEMWRWSEARFDPNYEDRENDY